MESRDDLTLRFWYIERKTVCFRDASDEEDDKADKLGNHVPHTRLRLDNSLQAERSRKDDHTHDRQSHEYFVRDHLRGTPHRTQQGVLVVRRPTAENDAVGTHR